VDRVCDHVSSFWQLRTMEWRFTIDDVRIKLKNFPDYP